MALDIKTKRIVSTLFALATVTSLLTAISDGCHERWGRFAVSLAVFVTVVSYALSVHFVFKIASHFNDCHELIRRAQQTEGQESKTKQYDSQDR